MKHPNLLYVITLLLFSSLSLQAYNIGLCFTATRKYTRYIEPFLASCRQHFLKDHTVTYFIFTDQDIPQKNDADVVVIHQEHLQWPYVTLFRFEQYYNARELMASMDYIFASDVDMRFVADVGDEILSDRVATQHPYFLDMNREKYDYEKNPYSTACIFPDEGARYLAGGFYGGSRAEFLKLCKTNADNIRNDYDRSFVAVWHDESHLNRYFVDNPPTLVLSSSYCYPESMELPMKKILLALDKNYNEVRW